MEEDRDQNAKTGDETEDREARRKDSGAGNTSVGAVDGIGGAGGASGTGGVRAKARAVGDISGIDPVDEQVTG
jgi:hypothetical protein